MATAQLRIPKKTLTTKPISTQRPVSHIVEEIKQHFRDFQRCKEYWGILDEDVYNFDETGFQIGVTSGKRSLFQRTVQWYMQQILIIRSLLPQVETVNYAGKKVPPMIIFQGHLTCRSTLTMTWMATYYLHVLVLDILMTCLV
jgi:hypothetical protein